MNHFLKIFLFVTLLLGVNASVSQAEEKIEPPTIKADETETKSETRTPEPKINDIKSKMKDLFTELKMLQEFSALEERLTTSKGKKWVQRNAHTVFLLMILGISEEVSNSVNKYIKDPDNPYAYLELQDAIFEIVKTLPDSPSLYFQITGARILEGRIHKGLTVTGLERRAYSHFLTRNIIGFVGFFGWEFGRELYQKASELFKEKTPYDIEMYEIQSAFSLLTNPDLLVRFTACMLEAMTDLNLLKKMVDGSMYRWLTVDMVGIYVAMGMGGYAGGTVGGLSTLFIAHLFNLSPSATLALYTPMFWFFTMVGVTAFVLSKESDFFQDNVFIPLEDNFTTGSKNNAYVESLNHLFYVFPPYTKPPDEKSISLKESLAAHKAAREKTIEQYLRLMGSQLRKIYPVLQSSYGVEEAEKFLINLILNEDHPHHKTALKHLSTYAKDMWEITKQLENNPENFEEPKTDKEVDDEFKKILDLIETEKNPKHPTLNVSVSLIDRTSLPPLHPWRHRDAAKEPKPLREWLKDNSLSEETKKKLILKAIKKPKPPHIIKAEAELMITNAFQAEYGLLNRWISLEEGIDPAEDFPWLSRFASPKKLYKIDPATTKHLYEWLNKESLSKEIKNRLIIKTAERFQKTYKEELSKADIILSYSKIPLPPRLSIEEKSSPSSLNWNFKKFHFELREKEQFQKRLEEKAQSILPSDVLYAIREFTRLKEEMLDYFTKISESLNSAKLSDPQNLTLLEKEKESIEKLKSFFSDMLHWTENNKIYLIEKVGWLMVHASSPFYEEDFLNMHEEFMNQKGMISLHKISQQIDFYESVFAEEYIEKLKEEAQKEGKEFIEPSPEEIYVYVKKTMAKILEEKK